MLTLIRGLPGSGKSTLAKQLQGDYSAHFEADMFFIRNGVYTFDASRIKDAHEWCQKETRNCLRAGMDVIVSNTFSQIWEMHPYMDMVDEENLHIIQCTGRWKNVHNVPEEVIEKMRKRWQLYI